MPAPLSRPRQSPGAVAPLDAALRALADPTRRQILVMLRDRERAAGDIATAFSAISRPAVSQHLGVLHQARLVEVRRDGNRRLYRARPEGLEEVWAFIEQMWQGSLQRLKTAAERAEAARLASPPEEA
ncbi:MAG: ArsR/SmtB family transcription factor [Acidimicrobiales bacterium]